MTYCLPPDGEGASIGHACLSSGRWMVRDGRTDTGLTKRTALSLSASFGFGWEVPFFSSLPWISFSMYDIEFRAAPDARVTTIGLACMSAGERTKRKKKKINRKAKPARTAGQKRCRAHASGQRSSPIAHETTHLPLILILSFSEGAVGRTRRTRES